MLLKSCYLQQDVFLIEIKTQEMLVYNRTIVENGETFMFVF